MLCLWNSITSTRTMLNNNVLYKCLKHLINNKLKNPWRQYLFPWQRQECLNISSCQPFEVNNYTSTRWIFTYTTTKNVCLFINAKKKKHQEGNICQVVLKFSKLENRTAWSLSMLPLQKCLKSLLSIYVQCKKWLKCLHVCLHVFS